MMKRGAARKQAKTRWQALSKDQRNAVFNVLWKHVEKPEGFDKAKSEAFKAAYEFLELYEKGSGSK